MAKKRFIRNVALLLLPILLYYAVFIVFEPNNYFGLHKSAVGDDIMAALRNYEDAPQNAVILGDSRTAKFNMEDVAAIRGHSYANLSYGGANLKEQLDILDWVLQRNPNLEEVVFSLSFYTVNQNYNHDRKVILALNNPLVYLTNLGYNINMLTNLQNHLTGAPLGGHGETMDPENYEYEVYEDPITGAQYTLRSTVASHLRELAGRTQNWALNTPQFNRLLKTIETCTARGVRFVAVFPPAHEDVLVHIVEAFGILPGGAMETALQSLHQSGALVLDYELENRPPLRDDQFYDGFHLDTRRGLGAFTQLLFTDIKNAAP